MLSPRALGHKFIRLTELSASHVLSHTALEFLLHQAARRDLEVYTLSQKPGQAPATRLEALTSCMQEYRGLVDILPRPGSAVDISWSDGIKRPVSRPPPSSIALGGHWWSSCTPCTRRGNSKSFFHRGLMLCARSYPAYPQSPPVFGR